MSLHRISAAEVSRKLTPFEPWLIQALKADAQRPKKGWGLEGIIKEPRWFADRQLLGNHWE